MRIEAQYFGKIPLEGIYLEKHDDTAVLAFSNFERQMLAEETVEVNPFLVTASGIAQRLLERSGTRYWPGMLQNFRSYSLDRNAQSASFVVNKTNYGSLVAVRLLLGRYLASDENVRAQLTESEVEAVAKHVSPLAVSGCLITRNGELVLAQRQRTLLSGFVATLPAGNIPYDSDIENELWSETKEEIYNDPNIPTKELLKSCVDEEESSLIGVVKGFYRSFNPALIFRVQSRYGLDAVRRTINENEHDPATLHSLKLDKDEMLRYVEDTKGRLIDNNGVGSLLLLGEDLFGREYRDDMASIIGVNVMPFPPSF